MEKTIGDLKIGDRLVMGKYAIRAREDRDPQPIIWLKASQNCDFLSEYALDTVLFDAREPESAIEYYRYGGNPIFTCSNLVCWLNSEYEDWYRALHDCDSPPVRKRISSYNGTEHHTGFLYDFEDYEIESLIVQKIGGEIGLVRIRLPDVNEVLGDHRFPLFKHRGVRPKASEDLLRHTHYYTQRSYVEYWTMSRNALFPNYVDAISRAGVAESHSPVSHCGLRPVCSILPERTVEPVGDGVYRLVPFHTIAFDTFSDEDFYKLMGIARP